MRILYSIAIALIAARSFAAEIPLPDQARVALEKADGLHAFHLHRGRLPLEILA